MKTRYTIITLTLLFMIFFVTGGLAMLQKDQPGTMLNNKNMMVAPVVTVQNTVAANELANQQRHDSGSVFSGSVFISLILVVTGIVTLRRNTYS